MSNERFVVIQAVAVTDSRISNAEFRILAALSLTGDEDGWFSIFPLVDNTTKAAVKHLTQLGYIEASVKNNGKNEDRYRIALDMRNYQSKGAHNV